MMKDIVFNGGRVSVKKTEAGTVLITAEGHNEITVYEISARLALGEPKSDARIVLQAELNINNVTPSDDEIPF